MARTAKNDILAADAAQQPPAAPYAAESRPQ